MIDFILVVFMVFVFWCGLYCGRTWGTLKGTLKAFVGKASSAVDDLDD